MDLTNIDNIISILEKYGTRPDKRLGQNFLVDRDVLDLIVEVSGVTRDDYVLEVGPGLGVLTRELAKNSKSVLACELDRKMTKILAETVGDKKNVRIFQGDVFSKDFYKIFSEWLKGARNKEYKIVSNLPYQITSFFLRNFLLSPVSPKDMTLMLQKEVAQRITAKPGDMNLLAILCQSYSEPEIIGLVSRDSFYPKPEVDSAIIKLALSKGFLRENKEIDPKVFFRLVKCGFSAKRKTLVNNLANGLKIEKEKAGKMLESLNIDIKARAESLGFNDWLNIFREVKTQDSKLKTET